MKISVEHVYTIIAVLDNGLERLLAFHVDDPNEMKRFMVSLRDFNRDKDYISVSVEKKCITTYKYR